MKKVTKRHNKRGFTLLEVLLATVIMSIVSLMIMQGFLATMNFAHNNSIYSRSGTDNYSKCVAYISNNVNTSLQTRIFSHVGEAKSDTKLSPAPGAFEGGNTYVIGTVHHEENSVVTPHENVAGKITTEFNETAAVNYHRHVFFYQPVVAKCPNDTGSKLTHKVRYCIVETDRSLDGWYCTESGCDYSVAGHNIPLS